MNMYIVRIVYRDTSHAFGMLGIMIVFGSQIQKFQAEILLFPSFLSSQLVRGPASINHTGCQVTRGS